MTWFWRVCAVLLWLLAALSLVANYAHADPDPMCNFSHTCGDWGNEWNGQQMPTWDTPGTYGGWTNTPTQCTPGGVCSRWVPNP